MGTLCLLALLLVCKFDTHTYSRKGMARAFSHVTLEVLNQPAPLNGCRAGNWSWVLEQCRVRLGYPGGFSLESEGAFMELSVTHGTMAQCESRKWISEMV